MALAVCTSAGLASGQTTYNWAAPVDGTWLDAARWSSSQVPDAFTHRAVLGFAVPYVVTVPGGSAIELNALELQNPSATLHLSPSLSSPRTILTMDAIGILNNGRIVLESGTSTARSPEITSLDNSVIGGTGMIELVGDKSVIQTTFPSVIRHANGHTIRGCGTLTYVQNEGLIVADQAGKSLIYKGVNDGTIRVENGAKMIGSAIASDGTMGRYVVSGAGSSISASITRGILESAGGEFNGSGQALTDCMVETQATIRLSKLSGELRNDGNIDLHGMLTLSNLTWPGDNSVRFTGDGLLRMTNQNAVLRHSHDGLAINEASHTIAGTGLVWGKSTVHVFVNEGTISADVAGSQLRVRALDNRGVIEAVNGGVLVCEALNFATPTFNSGVIVAHEASALKDSVVFQRATGTIRADGGVLSGSYLNGGLIETLNGGVARDCEISDATFRGSADVTRLFSVSGTVTLEAAIDVPAGADFVSRATHKPTWVTGHATIRLLDRATSRFLAGDIFRCTLGSGVEIKGAGILWGDHNSPLVIECVVSPGLEDDLIGQFDVAGTFLGVSAETVMDVASATQADSLVASGSLAIGGTLRVRLPGEYIPEPCTEVVLISTAGAGSLSGQFHTLELPEMPLGRMNVRYDPNAVILIYNPADYDGSTFVDIDDFTAFISDFEAGADAADFNNSGFVDTDDFTDFVTAFEQGC
jgi:hypothetical protein